MLFPGNKVRDTRAELDKTETQARRLRALLDARVEWYRAALDARLQPMLDAQLQAVRNKLYAELAVRGVRAKLEKLDARAERLRAELDARLQAELDARLQAERFGRVWRRLGFFLPAQSKEKFLGPALAEHATDLYEALVAAGARGKQSRLIIYYTLLAFTKVLDCTRVTVQRRFHDEFNWVAVRLTRK